MLAPREKLFVNSLGTRFVSVPMSADVRKSLRLSIWQTRVQDYAAYTRENPGVDMSWKDPEHKGVPITPGPSHPVVNR